MKLQQFLQLESEKFAEAMIDKEDWFLSDHDTRLINKVLDEVKREVEKKCYDDEIQVFSTIIDQLKLK